MMRKCVLWLFVVMAVLGVALGALLLSGFQVQSIAATLGGANIFTAPNAFITLTPGNCVQAGTGSVLVSALGPCATSLPLYLNAGAPTSQANECAGVTTDGSGDLAVVAIAALRAIDPANKGHDVLCMITVDATIPNNVGSLVFPYINAFGTSAGSQGVKGWLEVSGTGSTGVILTNASGANYTNTIYMRSCNGPGATGCGGNFQLQMDGAAQKKLDLNFNLLGDGTPLYMGNVANSTHPGIYMGGSNADSAAVFGIDRVLGQQSHIVRLGSGHGDVWGTLTLVAGTVTYNFNRNFTDVNPPICQITWQGGGVLTGIYKCLVNGSSGAWTGITVSSSVNTDTAKFAYDLKGNNF